MYESKDYLRTKMRLHKLLTKRPSFKTQIAHFGAKRLK